MTPTQRGRAVIPALLLALTLCAGAAAMWQWQRALHHADLAKQATQQQSKPRNLNLEANTGVGLVRLSGRWLPESTVFISPRMMDGRMGAWAVSVLQYQDATASTRHLAVQRGWAQQTQPMLAPVLAPLPSGVVTLQGQLVDALPRAFELSAVKPSSLGVWANHSLAAHGDSLRLRLEPGVLVLSDASPDADAPQLRRVPAQQAIDLLNDKAASNRGYMVQWFGLFIVGLVGLAWMWRNRYKPN